MAAAEIADLVSQSEKEGLTLAEVISSELSPQEIDELQTELSEQIAANYCGIEDFMSDVSVPSLAEILSSGEFAQPECDLPEETELSDDDGLLFEFV